MDIRRLYIKDFGIFNNQSLNNIDSDIVVVGGLNRAGKTTLMTILRYLGYGFPRNKNLPPAANKYEVEGDIFFKQDKYNIQLKGYADPIINNLDQSNKINSIRDVYHLDYFTYQQLFSLSLNELKRIPAGVDDKEKLQSILIGAGFSEMLQLPQLEDYFRKEAKQIGGKYGRSYVGKFKPYYENIEEALEMRKKANNQLEEYYQSQKNLEKLDQEFDKYEEKLADYQYQRDRLDVLKNNYQDYKKYLEIKRKLDNPDIGDLLKNFPDNMLTKIDELKPKYQEKLDSYRKLISKFKKGISVNWEREVQKLLEYKEQINTYYNELSGLREQIKNYKTSLEKNQKKKNNILIEAEKVNDKWSSAKQFTEILQIDTDMLEINKLNQIIDRYNQLNEKIRSLQEDITEIKALIEGKKKRKKNEAQKDSAQFTKNYYYYSLFFIAAGFGLIYINRWLGIFTGLAGLGGILLYTLNRLFQNYKRRELGLEQEIKNLEEKLTYKKEELKKYRDKFRDIKQEKKDYCEKLELKNDVSPETLRDYYRELVRLKTDIRRWKEQSETINNNKDELLNRLETIYNLIKQFSFLNLDFEPGTSLLKKYELLFTGVKDLIDNLKLATQLNQKKKEVVKLEQKINEMLDCDKSKDSLIDEMEYFLNKGEKYQEYIELKRKKQNLKSRILTSLKTDRIKEAFKDYSNKYHINSAQVNQMLTIFDSFFQEYTSLDDINSSYDKCEEKIKNLEKKIEKLHKKRQSVKDKINKLQTSSKLQKAQKKIDKNRGNLKKLAEEYAINKTAQFILKKVRERFMKKTKHKVFNNASDIFEKITEGEYQQILPTNKLKEMDFKAVLKNDKSQKTNLLSRGTKEQLFLAIRLSRIRQINPSLPVIMDDTLVNFDRYHLDQTLELFKELSKTHQIFVLTCHPHFIKHLAEKNCNVQYWKLHDGIVTKSDENELINHLSKKN